MNAPVIQRGFGQRYLIPWGTAGVLTTPTEGGSAYYYGNLTVSATAGVNRIYIPRAGVIRRIDGVCYTATPGSAEQSTLSFRLNNTTDTTVSSVVQNDATTFVFNNNSLAIAVAMGDYFEFKWVTPTWATNPASIFFHGTVLVE